ncbi:MAG: DUF2723 domain-containing protein, partial [Leptospiraceae bacterium]|nr:DUF2723 domain-containing protein [Leptospiraceae bacterium]
MKIFTRFFPFILFLFYLYHAPTTVQDGDSGELVTNAFIFGVPHPPGFPLFIWIYGIFELIFPFGTVYFKASLLTIFFSISSIFLLNKISEDRNKFITIGILLTFATSRIFWRYSIIPDAYMLNSFLIICISYIYFKKIPNYKNAGIINLLFFLGLTNHQTIILLLPIVLYYSYKSVNFKKIPFVFILPVPIFILLYFSLFLMNDKEPITWNYIRSIPDLIHHITRADYGRFVLVANKPREHYFEVIVFFGKTIFNDFGILFLSIPFVFLFLKRNYKNISVRTYLYASILIFHLAVVMQGFNIEPYKEHTETLSKHFLLPILLLIILASRFPWSNYINPKWKAGILFFPIILGNFTNYYELNNYRKNTIIEDYSRNLLLSVEEKNSVLIVTGDSIWFSLAYLQTVEKINPNIAILKPNMLSGKWVLQKINDKHPNLN